MVPCQSESAELLKEHGHSDVCSMEDVACIKNVLRKIFREREIESQGKIIDLYSRSSQIMQLDKKLRSIL